MDFRHVIFVLTSNLGSQFLIDPLLSPEEKRKEVMAQVRAAFKPEFLNHLDNTPPGGGSFASPRRALRP